MNLRIVTQYRRRPLRSIPLRQPRGTLVALAAIVASGGPVSSAVGQSEQAPVEFRARIVDESARTERITVPLHRSVTVETTVEIARADIMARDIADVQVVSPTRVLISGQKFGTTALVLFGTDDKQYVFEIAVELDLGQLNETLASIDPLSTAQAKSVLGHIVLSGTVSSSDRAQRMVEMAELFLPPSDQRSGKTTVQNHLELAGEQQVLLRVVVAEVSRSAARELSVNGFLAGENFRDGFLINQVGGINPISIGAAAAQDITRNMVFLTDEGGIPVSANTTLSLGFPRVQMQLFLKAMADNSLLRVLAEPNLVAVTGETATFLAGGEFPILVPQGDFRVTVEFREFGVRLNFTPLVRGHQRIRLHIAQEVSELDFSAAVQFQGFVVPGLSSRSTETVVELGSGQTIAIAGLLSEEIRGVASRIPGFGDIPILGSLFRSVQFQRSMTELVILVTPEIVAPLEPHQKVRLPGEDFASPSDLELYALGILESRHSADQADQGAAAAELDSEPEELSIHGPWGHAGTGDLR